MVAGYGHDDRVCAYTSLRAVLDETNVTYTSCAVLVDKEEIGSVGATGAQSKWFENCIAELLNKTVGFDALKLRHAMENTKMLSSDVSAGFDPLYPQVNEAKNSAYLGNGICFNKYTGSKGKSGSNDYRGYNDNHISYKHHLQIHVYIYIHIFDIIHLQIHVHTNPVISFHS